MPRQIFRFTLESSLKARDQGKLDQWVTSYLESEGKNHRLSKILRQEKYIWSDIVEYPLDKLERVMGYEEGMKFHEDRDKWERRVSYFTICLERGESFAPLISTDFWGEVDLSDGSHRFEALKKSGYKKYWTIFYIKSEDNKEMVLKNISQAKL